MKNTTLSRKPGNTMRKGQGADSAKPQGDQSGDGADFAFNGQMGDGVNRASNRYAGNQHAGIADPNRLHNRGMGPRKGNTSSAPEMESTPQNFTRHQMTIATASQSPGGNNVESGASRRSYPANSDAIYVAHRDITSGRR